MNLNYLLHRIYYNLKKYSPGQKEFLIKCLDMKAKKIKDYYRVSNHR